ncbi:ATP-binding protein [Actimicrobium sp. CCC2.4]|uniref:ATP-binding protein n=1 Tax=Actimicrobium sp. CCC2.4 TaxID=3048606 RepID=UPI002AC95995|nr:ATP-binding protein [Actimicrobium sp. CCC2.4]MEB0136131.1 ATP-binding protein [Actimicrobium sp. CCC2.4]WPX32113.1 ATP-binding protein [Actimicrobium sp. CCC2.4]
MLMRLATVVVALRLFARHRNSEHEQALVRMAMASLICLLVVWQSVRVHTSDLMLALIGFFLCLSALILADVRRRPQPVRTRRIIAILNDAGGITCGMLFAGELGMPIYLFYLWITFGNGFRFGKPYLYGTLLASLAGLSVVLWQVDYWAQHRALGVGLWCGLALLGLYFSTLVTRLTGALQREEAANQAKRNFISSVSHEMRTPLNAIIGMTDLLQGTRLDREQQAMLGSLDTAAQLMLALVEDVLDFSKIEAGKLVIEDTAFDPHRLAGDIIDLFRYQAVARDLQLRLEIDPALPHGLYGDPHHLRQVLVNLMSNAIKFTEQGHVVLRIALLPDDGECVRVRFDIEDTGIGIAPAAQARIFDSFTQADASTTRRYGGTGLGTTISRQLVESMGGQLGLRSSVGVGSTFWFALALRPHGPAGAVEVVAPPRRLPSACAYAVLVADDNATNRTVLRMMLERAGHQCTLAEDGEQVLDLLEEHSFDAVILDMNMPHMNGLEATRAIRFTTLPGRHLPLIMLSADVSAETREECRLAGIDQFLPKPIRIDDLLDALDRLIAGPGAPGPHAGGAPLRIVPPPVVSLDTVLDTVLDAAALAELEAIGHDVMFVDGLVAGFIADTQVLMAQIAVAIGNQQLGALRDLLHALKGSAMSIGAQALCTTCAQLEERSDADLRREGRALLTQLQQAVDQLLDALDRYRHTRSHCRA